jgi:hypothetical protein
MEEIKLYNGKVTITFTERDWNGKKIHSYTDEKGNKLLSVTSITGLVDKSGPLMYWATDLMGKYLFDNYNGKPINQEILQEAKKKYKEAKQEAADIGTAIHDWVEQKIKGLEPAMPKNEKVRNGAMAALKWLASHKIEITHTERIVYSKKYGYVGKCDWDGIDKDDNELVIGDHKSSKGIYPEMFMQLSAYWKATEEETGKKYKRGYIVKYGKDDGEFEVKEISRTDNEKNFKAFLGLLSTKKRLNEMNNERN